jgi:secondary thiamine-phosphate synthase enzyme
MQTSTKTLFEFNLKTEKLEQFKDITILAEKALNKSKISSGIINVFCPHTTAGITINENADSDVVNDIITTLDKVFPVENNYKHSEGNSHAHIKASYMGSSCTVPFENGTLKLGTWQGIYFCEFDGPRNRKVYIKIIEG